jgi:hypothetical protein
MGGIVMAWIAGESIVFYRWGKLKAPPTPGTLAMSSGVFLALAVIGSYAPARTFATIAAVGVDLAILLQVLGKTPAGITGWPPPVMDDSTTRIFPSGTQTPAAAGDSSAPKIRNVANPGAPLS